MSRDEIFITTKLWCNSHHPDDVESALDDSLRDLASTTLIYTLCNTPVPSDFMPMGPDGKIIPDSTDFVDTWKAMEKLLLNGKVKAIGVSNFSKLELERILKECGVVSKRKSVMPSDLQAIMASRIFQF